MSLVVWVQDLIALAEVQVEAEPCFLSLSFLLNHKRSTSFGWSLINKDVSLQNTIIHIYMQPYL